MDKKFSREFMKWIALIAFALMLLGGLNWLIIGLFKFDIFAEIFGTSTACRIIYVLFGLASLILGAIVCCRAFRKKNEQKPAQSKSTRTNSAAAIPSSAGETKKAD